VTANSTLPEPGPETAPLFRILALMALVMGLACTGLGIGGMMKEAPQSGLLTGFGVAVSGLAVWLFRWAGGRPGN